MYACTFFLSIDCLDISDSIVNFCFIHFIGVLSLYCGTKGFLFMNITLFFFIICTMFLWCNNQWIVLLLCISTLIYYDVQISANYRKLRLKLFIFSFAIAWQRNHFATCKGNNSLKRCKKMFNLNRFHMYKYLRYF